MTLCQMLICRVDSVSTEKKVSNFEEVFLALRHSAEWQLAERHSVYWLNFDSQGSIANVTLGVIMMSVTQHNNYKCFGKP
jgi:hypothetical protein